MFWMKRLKHFAKTLQCRNVNIVHCVALQQQTIIPGFIGITEHHLQFLLCAMVVSLVISLKRSSLHIVVYKNRSFSICGTRNFNYNYELTSHIDCHNVSISQQVDIHLLSAVNSIPQVLSYLICVFYPYDFEPLYRISFGHIFIHAKQNNSTRCVGKSRISFPN